VLDAASEQDSVVFVHPEASSPPAATEPSWWAWALGYTAQMQAAYLSWLGSGRDRWPTLKVVFAILAGGAPFQLERLTHRGEDVRSSLDPNTFFDVATYGRRAIELVIETFGVHQLVYGSDTPVVDPRRTLDAVRGFGDSVTYVLQSETPSALLT
jgi:predicted TIM-barrel fold metal-dependent hydrolase